MPDEELFSIRLPDGSQQSWTLEAIAAYQDDFQITLYAGQEQMMNEQKLPGSVPLADMDNLIDKVQEQAQREALRQMIREEIDRLLPTITERVSAGLTRAIRMRGGRKP